MKRENGLVFASYLIWGLLPLFWKQLSMVNSAYVLASRIIWSAIFCGSLLLLRRRWNRVRIALADKGEVGLIFLCAILISINWGLYIFSIAIGKVLESSGSLDELSRQLAPYGCFYRPHRSYLVNLEYVQTLSYRAITLACLAEIPIPRGKYNEVKSAFLDYAFQKGQVTV